MQKGLIILMVSLVVVSLYSIVFAEIYVWKGRGGVKHFSNTQPPNWAENIKEEKEISTNESIEYKNKYRTNRSSKKIKNKQNGHDHNSFKGMKYPKDGSCEDFYLFIEGVCVHPKLDIDGGFEMKAAINNFKRTGKIPPVETRSETVTINDESRCEKYSKQLERYIRDGVMGINPITGKLSKMTGEAADQVIQNTKDNIEIFCGI